MYTNNNYYCIYGGSQKIIVMFLIGRKNEKGKMWVGTIKGWLWLAVRNPVLSRRSQRTKGNRKAFQNWKEPHIMVQLSWQTLSESNKTFPHNTFNTIFQCFTLPQ